MGAPAVLERLVRAIGHGLTRQEKTPQPDYLLSIRNLPFEQKWQEAQGLKPYQQADFFHQEVYNLIPDIIQRGRRKGEIKYTIDYPTIYHSQLSPEMKEYLLTALQYDERRGYWGRPSIVLRLSAYSHSYRWNAAIASLAVEFVPPPRGPRYHGGPKPDLHKSGVAALMQADDGRGWRFWAELDSPSVPGTPIVPIEKYPNLNKPRRELEDYLKQTPAIVVAGKLMKFAHQVISARAQPPAPTPPAAA